MWPPSTKAAENRIITKRRSAHPEDDLQEAVVRFLDVSLPPQAGIMWSAVMNGVHVTATARRRLKCLGLRPGVPDLVFIPVSGPLVGGVYFVELKSDTGRPTIEQKKIVEALGPDRACFARSVVEVQDALLRWGLPLRARV